MKALINGNIYTSFKPLRRVSGIVISNGRVIYAGDSEVAKRIAKMANGEVQDLKGKYVIPAFFDSHLHLDELGMSLEMVDLRGVKSMEELLERLKRGRGRIVFGFGWDQDELGEWPTKDVLNEIDRPVFIYRKCFHVAVANDEMLKLLNLPSSEDFEEDTGIIKENALGEARRIINEKVLSLEDYIHYIEKAQEHLLNLGVKSVAFMSVNEKSLRALFALEREGKLKINVFAYLNPSLLDYLERIGMGRFGSDRLVISGVKLFTDGSLGARTALLSEPYEDDPSTSGQLVMEEEELVKVIERAKALGLDVAIHAIGDKGLDVALNAFEEAGFSGRIEHASVVRDDQLERIKRLKVRLSVQPHFIISDWWVVERVGERRARWVYRFKDLANVTELGFSTDSPIEPADPWLTIDAAINRGKGKVKLYELTKDQALTFEEAMHHYTYGSAKVSLANDIGKLEPGFKAEYIVMDRDPLVMK
ncbi:exoenzyme regulatory protein aepa precursor [Pyrococcus sp. NA2]|uniref:amidohydrolase n=1 Tax=Pyrococcus sp. (strain NA2) TaxID=342949 RepID=UPI000209AB80|nr:amidohydrolase [Pyrococcus sp. NA2]AEC52667.1 exoenzyme regulatory protein aepa precursor [Pyrococcus sp. NA2]